jgi:hypothetical protein
MTYYKYVKRDATSQVNWADVSKKFSDEISRIGTERDKKRAEIDKATDELVTKINEAPMGQHKNANLFTSQLVDQATQDTLRMNKLLKSGDIKPSEYMNYIENQKSSVTGIYDMVKGYQDVYTDKMERLQNGESLSMEADGMAVVEGFGNFANITPVMDMYGNVTMYNNSTGDTMSSAQMNAITKQYFNAYDLDGDLTGKAGQLGDYVKVIMADNVLTRADVTASPEYEKVKTDLIDATLEGNLSVSTVLDKKLVGYGTSYSAKTAGERDILMIDDPRQPGSGAQIPLVEVVEQVSNMTEDQKREIFPEGVDVNRLIGIAKAQRKEARKWVETDLTSRFDMIETPQREFPESTTGGRGMTEAERKRQMGVSVTQDGVDNLQAIFTAKDNEQNELEGAISYFEAKNPNVDLEVVERDGKRQFAIKRADEDETRYVAMDDYNTFVEAAGPFVMQNTEYLTEVLDRSPIPEGRGRGTAFGGARQQRAVDLENIGAETVKYVQDGDEIEVPLRDYMEGLPKPGEQTKNADETVIRASNEIKTALDQLNLSETIKVSPVIENTLEDLYGRFLGMSTIDYPGVQIEAPNMPNGVVVSYEPNDVSTIGPLLELIATGRPVTMEDLYAVMGDESITITKELIDNGHLGIEQPPIANPNKQGELD